MVRIMVKAKGSLIRKQCGCGRMNVSTGLNAHGVQTYRNRCRTCIRRAQALKKAFCEHCGVQPEDRKMLHTDHIDMDPSNNIPENIQTLCVSCHVKKTKQDKAKKREVANV
jgi:5-methylcytosine-specific restriction endonuclease McrA